MEKQSRFHSESRCLNVNILTRLAIWRAVSHLNAPAALSLHSRVKPNYISDTVGSGPSVKTLVLVEILGGCCWLQAVGHGGFIKSNNEETRRQISKRYNTVTINKSGGWMIKRCWRSGSLSKARFRISGFGHLMETMTSFHFWDSQTSNHCSCLWLWVFQNKEQDFVSSKTSCYVSDMLVSVWLFILSINFSTLSRRSKQCNKLIDILMHTTHAWALYYHEELCNMFARCDLVNTKITAKLATTKKTSLEPFNHWGCAAKQSHSHMCGWTERRCITTVTLKTTFTSSLWHDISGMQKANKHVGGGARFHSRQVTRSAVCLCFSPLATRVHSQVSSVPVPDDKCKKNCFLFVEAFSQGSKCLLDVDASKRS